MTKATSIPTPQRYRVESPSLLSEAALRDLRELYEAEVIRLAARRVDPQQWRPLARMASSSRANDSALAAFTASQRESGADIHISVRKLGSEEWSRRLREKVAASKERERHQVLCDLQDEP